MIIYWSISNAEFSIEFWKNVGGNALFLNKLGHSIIKPTSQLTQQSRTQVPRIITFPIKNPPPPSHLTLPILLFTTLLFSLTPRDVTRRKPLTGTRGIIQAQSPWYIVIPTKDPGNTQRLADETISVTKYPSTVNVTPPPPSSAILPYNQATETYSRYSSNFQHGIFMKSRTSQPSPDSLVQASILRVKHRHNRRW